MKYLLEEWLKNHKPECRARLSGGLEPEHLAQMFKDGFEKNSQRYARPRYQALYCPQCGEACDELVEGYCEECTEQNYSELQAHEDQKRWWDSLSEEDKHQQVQNQLRFTC